MKKIFLSMALAIVVLAPAIAAPADKEPSVLVKNAFTKEFAQVKEVKWDVMNEAGVYEAHFMFNNQSLIAYFSEDGQFLGTMRQIPLSNLPVLATTAVAKKYAGYRAVSVYEYSTPGDVSYYITVTKPDGKEGLVIKATANGETEVYKKLKAN